MAEGSYLGYEGTRALIVGGASGMGRSAAMIASREGADITVMDFAEVEYDCDRSIRVDLQDRSDLDRAISEIDGPVDAVFCAAGIAGGPGVMKVNFISHRHLIDCLLADGRLRSGAAICFISSVAGMGWQQKLPLLIEFLEQSGYKEAQEWIDAHPGTNNYMFSKMAMNAYVAREAYHLAPKGIRINGICPGPTDTPLARANSWLDNFASDYREATGVPTLVPDQMGSAMVFLNSRAASGVSGVSLLVDSGHVMSSLGGAYGPGQPVMQFIMAGELPSQ